VAIAYLRFFAQRYKLLWLLYLALALIGTQSANIHLHVYGHPHHAEEPVTGGHDHLSAMHICGTACDTSHDHENVTEWDIAPEGVVKNLSFGSLILALLASVITVFFTQGLCPRIGWHRAINTLPWWQTALRPPLRAPPI